MGHKTGMFQKRSPIIDTKKTVEKIAANRRTLNDHNYVLKYITLNKNDFGDWTKVELQSCHCFMMVHCIHKSSKIAFTFG